jgi:hypothetical protein
LIKKNAYDVLGKLATVTSYNDADPTHTFSQYVVNQAQVIVLMACFSRREAPLCWSDLAATAARSVAATLLMVAAGTAALWLVPFQPGLGNKLLRVVLPLGPAIAVFCAA